METSHIIFKISASISYYYYEDIVEKEVSSILTSEFRIETQTSYR